MNKEQILEAIKAMTVLELNDLVKAIEEEFGVTAAAPVAVVVNAGTHPLVPAVKGNVATVVPTPFAISIVRISSGEAKDL